MLNDQEDIMMVNLVNMIKAISKKVIEIDDAGWGDLLGGVYITVMRMDTYEHTTNEIHLTFFRGRAFEKKEYLNQAKNHILVSLEDLNVDHHEFEIHLCQGFLFSEAEEILLQQGWDVKRRRISGAVQQIVEGAYRDYVISLGFTKFLPVEQRMYERKRSGGVIELISRGKFRFFQFIDWIQEDPEARIKFVKTGFRSWSYWQYKIMSQAKLRQEYKKLKNKR